MSAPQKGLKWQWRAMLVSVAITIAAYVGISLYAGWADVAAVVAKVGWLGLAISLLLSLFNYILRFARWQYYLLHLGCTVPVYTSWQIYLSGFALTTTPGKAGEMVRSVFLNQHGVPASASVAAFVSERLSDLLAVLLLSCIGLWAYPNARLPVAAATVLLSAILCLLMYSPIIVKLKQFAATPKSKIHQIFQKVIEILAQAQRCHSPKMIVFTTLLSLVSWSMEAWAFYLLLYWCGFAVDYHFAFFVYAISMLVGALSFLPGGLGGAEATMVSLLVLKGVDTHTALAVTLFIRLTTLWFAVALGIVAFMRQTK